jgi:hypothetical protein
MWKKMTDERKTKEIPQCKPKRSRFSKRKNEHVERLDSQLSEMKKVKMKRLYWYSLSSCS